MSSKLYSVRVPSREIAAVESILAQFPGVSPALVFRALLLSAGRIGISNAISKHSEGKVWK